MKWMVAAVALLAAASASAGELWRGVFSGMSWDEAAELFPAGAGVKHKAGKQIEIADVSITEDCKAEANIYFEKGVVDRVVLKGAGSIRGRCSATVMEALASRYGAPASREQEAQSYFLRQGTVYGWNAPGLSVRLKRFTNEGSEGGGGGGGGGLLLSSWELTYRAPPTVNL